MYYFCLIFLLLATTNFAAEMIQLSNGVIHLSSPIIISNSNVRISGGSLTTLVLNSNANCPVIIIGVQGHEIVTNVQLSWIKIDGNRLNQNREEWKLSEVGNTIYNNGIIVQNARDIKIRYAATYNCRSGGLITACNVNNLIVSNFVTFNNQFDGIACYETTNSVFINILTFSNLAAGISLDMKFDDNLFYNVISRYNDIGIFMRHSSDNIFYGCKLLDNKKFDIFVSSVDDIEGTGCEDNIIDVTKMDGHIYNKDKYCTNNLISVRL